MNHRSSKQETIFQKDNAEARESGFKISEWNRITMASIGDRNPIENLWGVPGRKFPDLQESANMERGIKSAQANTRDETFDKLADGVPRGLISSNQK